MQTERMPVLKEEAHCTSGFSSVLCAMFSFAQEQLFSRYIFPHYRSSSFYPSTIGKTQVQLKGFWVSLPPLNSSCGYTITALHNYPHMYAGTPLSLSNILSHKGKFGTSTLAIPQPQRERLGIFKEVFLSY